MTTVAVVGAGGVGGYFGGRLAQAGYEVSFVARGKHWRRSGPLGWRCGVWPVTSTSRRCGRRRMRPRSERSDYVLVCVKTWQLADAITAIRPLVGSRTAIVTVQNGVEAPDQVAAEYGREAVLPGAAEVIAYVESPRTIRHLGGPGRLTFAEWDNQPTPRTEWLRTAFTDAGLQAVISADIWAGLWTKFLSVVPSGGLGTATGAGYGVLRSRPGTRQLLTDATTEIRDVALALDIKLPADVVPKTLAWIDNLPADGTTSLQRDILAGRPNELDAWTGAVVRLGNRAGVPTPVNSFLYEIAAARAI